MDAIVRRATADDLAILLELVEEYCAADAHRFDGDRARSGLAPLLDGDELGVVRVVEVEGVIDGYGVVTWGWSVEIGGLDVVLDELYVWTRGRGLGSLLIAALEGDCRARGVRRVFLETELANDAARRLYARHGYVADTSIWMSKELT